MSEASIEVDKYLYETLANNGLEAAILFAQSRATNELKQKGTPLTNEMQEFIVKASLQEVKQLTSSLRKLSLPEGLSRLFEFESKKEVKRFAENELVLHQSDFVNLIMNAELFGFRHLRKHKEFIPNDLKGFSPGDISEVDPNTKQFTKKGRKAFTKISQIFKQRRQLSVHWFEFGFEWHCFYHDFGDLLGGHWAGGDHIHYLSYLWGISSDQVWNGFDKRDYSPANAHIKYIHNLRER